MSMRLKTPIRKTGNVVWQTIEMDGRKWNLQVQLVAGVLENIVADSIGKNDSNHTTVSGPLVIFLTRQP